MSNPTIKDQYDYHKRSVEQEMIVEFVNDITQIKAMNHPDLVDKNGKPDGGTRYLLGEKLRYRNVLLKIADQLRVRLGLR